MITNEQSSIDNTKTKQDETSVEQCCQQDTVYCTICLENYSPFEVYTLKNCSHNFCIDCVRSYFQTLITNGETKICCLSSTCDSEISSSEINDIVDAALFAKYKKFCSKMVFHLDPSAHFCPGVGCENVIFVDSSTVQQKATCSECGTSFCILCKLPWHEGISCTKAKENDLTEDLETRKWKAKHGVQSCPRCGIQVIRAAGCSEIRCPNCKLVWNWKKDDEETLVETIAFFYPRTIAEIAGSRELHEDDKGLAEEMLGTIIGGGVTAILLLPFLAFTIVVGPPALAVRGGRLVAHYLDGLISGFQQLAFGAEE